MIFSGEPLLSRQPFLNIHSLNSRGWSRNGDLIIVTQNLTLLAQNSNTKCGFHLLRVLVNSLVVVEKESHRSKVENASGKA